MSYENATPAVRRPLDMQGGLLMLLFCLVLGLQQVAIKAVVADIAPLAQIALRSVLATVLVGIVVWRQRIALVQIRNLAGPGLLMGLCFASEFAFVAVGLNYTTASHMAVFLYTAPVFAALGLHVFVPGEKLAVRHWIGIAVAFAGAVLALLYGANGTGDAPALLLGDFLGLLAGLSWATSTIVIRRTSLSEAPPVLTLFYQLATATVLLLPVAVLAGAFDAVRLTPLVLASMTFQTLVIAFGAVLLWFALLRRYLASRLGVFSFFTPVFGVIFGVWLLGDPLTTGFIFGGVAIVAGVVLVSYPARAEVQASRRRGRSTGATARPRYLCSAKHKT